MTVRRDLISEELTHRTPVWLALSEPFLDTELTDADVRHIARMLRVVSARSMRRAQ